MALWIKKTAGSAPSNWSSIQANKIFVKTVAGSGWTQVKKIWVKGSISTWKLFWPKTGPTTDVVPSMYATTNGTQYIVGNTPMGYMPTPTSPAGVGNVYVPTQLTLNSGVWNQNGYTINAFWAYIYGYPNYTEQLNPVTLFSYTPSTNNALGVKNTTSGYTGDKESSPNPNTLNVDVTYDNQYLVYSLVAKTTQGVNGQDDSNAGGRIKIIKNPPVNISKSLIGTTFLGDTLNYSSSWQTAEGYSPDATQTQVEWWANSNANLTSAAAVRNGGYSIKTDQPAISSSYSFTIPSQDLNNNYINKYIYVIETCYNSGSIDGVSAITSSSTTVSSKFSLTNLSINDITFSPDYATNIVVASGSNNTGTVTWANGSNTSSAWLYSVTGAGSGGTTIDPNSSQTSGTFQINSTGTASIRISAINKSINLNASWTQTNSASYRVTYNISGAGTGFILNGNNPNSDPSLSTNITTSNLLTNGLQSQTVTITNVRLYSLANQQGNYKDFDQAYNNISKSGLNKTTYTDSSNSVTYNVTIPDPPTNLNVTDVGTNRPYGNAAYNLWWSAPAFTGYTTLTGYKIQFQVPSVSSTWYNYSSNTVDISSTPTSTSPLVLTGFGSGLSTNFKVYAVNSAGQSNTAVATSSPVLGTTVPEAPSISNVTAGDSQVSVAFSANNTGGSTITGFIATSSPGSFSKSGTSSPLLVTGLSNGTTYTFTVTATNANGTSSASTPSGNVTPLASPSANSISINNTTLFPGAISSVNVISGSNNKASITWANGSNTSSAWLYSVTGAGSGGTTIDPLAAQTSSTFDILSTGTANYIITAINKTTTLTTSWNQANAQSYTITYNQSGVGSSQTLSGNSSASNPSVLMYSGSAGTTITITNLRLYPLANQSGTPVDFSVNLAASSSTKLTDNSGSASVTYTDQTPPSSPTITVSYPAIKSFQLNATFGSKTTSIVFSYGSTPGSYTTSIGTLTANGSVSPSQTLADATTYYWQAIPYNGVIPGTAVTGTATTASAPDAPGNLQRTFNGLTKTFTWDEPNLQRSNLVRYEVNVNNTGWASNGTSRSFSASFSGGTGNTVQVRAVNGVGPGSAASTGSFYIPAVGTISTIPAKTSGTVSWTSTYQSSFSLTVSTTPQTVYTGTTATSTNVTSLSPNTSYSLTLVLTSQTSDTNSNTGTLTTLALSSIKTLSALSISSGTLSPSFSSSTNSYSVTVSNSVSSVTVTPTLTDFLSTMKVNGNALTSGSTSSAISLTAGSTTNISIVVTAEDGTTNTYTIGVYRNLPALALSFSNPVSNETGFTFQLTSTYDSSFSWSATVNGNPSGVTVSPANGSSAGQIYTVSGLNVNLPSATITIKVTKSGYDDATASVFGTYLTATVTNFTISDTTPNAVPSSITVANSGTVNKGVVNWTNGTGAFSSWVSSVTPGSSYTGSDGATLLTSQQFDITSSATAVATVYNRSNGQATISWNQANAQSYTLVYNVAGVGNQTISANSSASSVSYGPISSNGTKISLVSITVYTKQNQQGNVGILTSSAGVTPTNKLNSSTGSGAITYTNRPSGGTVTLSGNSLAGSTITASTSGWSDNPTSYDVYITATLDGNPLSSSSRVASSGGSSSVSYTITVQDAMNPANSFRAFATATNAVGTSSVVQSSNIITATPATYLISYNANGGSGAPPSQTKTSGVDLTLSTTIPTRSGYGFVNWNTAQDGSGTSYGPGATYSANAAATLWAQWSLPPATPTNGTGTYSLGTYYLTNASFTSSALGTTPITYAWSVYSSTSSSGPWTLQNSNTISSSSLSTTLNIPQQGWLQSTYGNWAQYRVYAYNTGGTSGTLTWTV